MIKKHVKNEFYVKHIRNGYYAVMCSYDYSMESLEVSKEAAEKTCKELNELHNRRLNLQ